MKKLLLIPLLFLACSNDPDIDPMPNGVVEPSNLDDSPPETYVVRCLLYQEVFFNFEIYDPCQGEAVAVEYSVTHDRLGNYLRTCKNESYGRWQARLWLPVRWPKEGVTVFWRPVYLECGEVVLGATRKLLTSHGFCQEPSWSLCE